jgi:hypothetical protein
MSRRRRGSVLGGVGGCAIAVALTAVALGAACGVENIDVVRLPGPEAGHAPCVTTSPDAGDAAPPGDAGFMTCEAGEFCQPTACNQTSGTCEPFPPPCDQPYAPVCGCDGITYFNDCVRQSAGVGAMSASGVCIDSPMGCNAEDSKCPDPRNSAGRSVCALVIGGILTTPAYKPYLAMFLCAVPAETFGFCWVVPSSPPAAAGSTLLQQADPLIPSCFSTCLNPYEALGLKPAVFVEDPDCLSDGGTDGVSEAGGPSGG